MNAVACTWDEPVPYLRALALQEALHAARLAGEIPDTVVFLEHPPVITLGRRARDNFLLSSREEIEARGIEIAVASRGGDVTYHAPGQLVCYPILKLGACGADAHGYLHNLEELAIRTASSFGVAAGRKEGKAGAWSSSGKIAAIGFRLRRWVSFHGMSFNVGGDLSGFDLIVPCGLAGEQVGCLADHLGDDCPPVSAVAGTMMTHFEAVMQRRLVGPGSLATAPRAVLARLLEGYPLHWAG